MPVVPIGGEPSLIFYGAGPGNLSYYLHIHSYVVEKKVSKHPKRSAQEGLKELQARKRPITPPPGPAMIPLLVLGVPAIPSTHSDRRLLIHGSLRAPTDY